MADIQAYLDAIENAIYGEDVRGSIHDAIEIINEVGEVVITAGTAVTSASSSTEGFFENSLYFNTNTNDLWQCNGSGWTLLGNLKGDQGDQGNPGQAATIAVGTVTKGDNASVVNSGTSSAAVFDFVLPKGDPGPAGVNTWGSLTGDIDDQTDLVNALDGTYREAESLVEHTVGWKGNNLFNIDDLVDKDISGFSSLDNKTVKIPIKAGQTYYLSISGTNNLQSISYTTDGISPTIVAISSFPYSFTARNDDTYIIIQFSKLSITKDDIAALKFMVSETDDAYNEYHKTVTDVITDVYGVMGENGAVNFLINKATSTGIFTVNANKSVTVETLGEGSTTILELTDNITNIDTTKNYRLSGCPSGGSASTYKLDFGNASYIDYGDGVVVPGSVLYNQKIRMVIYASAPVNKTFYPMLAPVEYKGGYVPYAMTNKELTDELAKKINIKPVVLDSTKDLNNILTTGFYTITTTPTHAPSDNPVYCNMIVISENNDDDNLRQMLYKNSAIYIRNRANNSWSNWYKYTGTEMT